MTISFASQTSIDQLTTQVPAVATLAARAVAAAAQGPRHESAVPPGVQASYTTRFVAAALHADPSRFRVTAGADVSPQASDVVLARVTEIRNHRRVETPESRKAILFEGKLVLLAYGDRYAADQFLAHVPDSLDHCHLVAAGGVAGAVTAHHDKISSPTAIEPLGLLTDEDGVVNLRRFAPYTNAPVVENAGRADRPEVVAVLGTSMNSGKSTVEACLVNGLSAAGQRVGAAKITGTGAGNDRMIYHDAGAHEVLDFTDFGYASTFKLAAGDIRALLVNTVEQLTHSCDVIIVEIADGVYQAETAALLRDPLFQSLVDHVLFAATDALGARAGVEALSDAGLPVSAATGVLTSSPLASAEAHEVLAPFGVPVVKTFSLTEPARATGLLARS